MFEQRGWTPEGMVHGPVPLRPSSLLPDDVLLWARRAPFTGAWIDALDSLEPDELGVGDRVELAVAWDRLRRGIDARFTAALGSVPEQPCEPDPHDPSCRGGSSCRHDWSAMEVQSALTIGPQHARHLLAEARELTRRLPGMLDEVSRGQASLLQARKLAVRTMDIDDDTLVARLARSLEGKADGRTAGAFDRMVQTAISRLRTTTEVREAYRRSVRALTGIRPLPPREDGLGRAELVGPGARIAELFGWAGSFTRHNRHPDDGRTVGQRRFDALIDGLTYPGGPGTEQTPVTAEPPLGESPDPAGQARPAQPQPPQQSATTRRSLRVRMAAWMRQIGPLQRSHP